jgi:hypothetical protein
MSLNRRERGRGACGWLLLLALSAACSAGNSGSGVMAAYDASAPALPADAGTVLPPVTCTADNRFCGDAGPTVVSAGPVCGNAPIDLEPVGVNVMVAVDGSKAMAAHWETMQLALKKMIEENLSLNFGAHLFWADVSSLEMVLDKLNFCGTTQNHVFDVGPGQQTQVLPFLGAVPPGPGAEFFSFRPVVEPLNYYLEHASKLADPKSTNYLVFISNGSDNCFGTLFARDEDKLLTYEKLAIELVKRNIRVLPIGFDGATAQTTLTSSGVGMLATNFDALDRLAKFGGTGLEKALTADSSEGLSKAIATVSQAVRSCRFSVPDAIDPSKNLNPFALEFLINDVPVPRDRTHKDGWDFVGGDTSQAEVFGDGCNAIRSGRPLAARTRCNTEDVCGTAATKLSTKPRAIQFLVDASASMLACSDPDPFLCLPEPLGSAQLAWWEVAVRSLATTVVATVNDDAEFGLQYLPARGSDIGSCEVASQPEVPTRDGSEIALISSALSTLPLGSTPLVAALEGIAAQPGRIAEPGVSAALVIMSDGGNSCGEILYEDAVRRLAEASAKLRARGVTTHVIKLGSANILEEEAQLRAIADNGGAPQTGGVPYLEAPTPDQLNAVLAKLSDELASCQLELGPHPKDADTNKVNLFIDGEQIPFDAQSAKQNGWGWANDARQTMLMYGEACTRFKKSRATNIVVEYGCVPQIVVLN